MEIVIIDPIRGGELSMIGDMKYFVEKCREENGRLVFRYNSRYNSCRVVRIENKYLPSTNEVTGNGQFSCE
jgi:hypothetical protein